MVNQHKVNHLNYNLEYNDNETIAGMTMSKIIRPLLAKIENHRLSENYRQKCAFLGNMSLVNIKVHVDIYTCI